jgi:TorA maturation chaperone TorD
MIRTEEKAMSGVEGMRELHSLRLAFYALLGRLYREGVDERLLAWLRSSEGPFLDFPIPLINQDLVNARAILASWCQSAEEGETEDLNRDYHDLLVVPPMAGPPYESPWIDSEHLMFQEPTLDVRRRYHQFGVMVPGEGRQPDDHIALELGFMAHLCEGYQESLARRHASNGHIPDDWLTAQRDFLCEHILTWIPDFATLIVEKAQTALYKGLGYLTVGFLAWDRLVLDELTGAL